MEAISILSGIIHILDNLPIEETQMDSYSLCLTSPSSPLLTLVKQSVSTLMALLDSEVMLLRFATVIQSINIGEVGAGHMDKVMIINTM